MLVLLARWLPIAKSGPESILGNSNKWEHS